MSRKKKSGLGTVRTKEKVVLAAMNKKKEKLKQTKEKIRGKIRSRRKINNRRRKRIK